MAFDLCFSPEFFFAEGEPYDGGPEPSERPISVWGAICAMPPHEWSALAKEVFGLANPDHLTPETVLEKIEETDTCGTLSSPVDVWIDPEGWYRIKVYDERSDES